MNLELDFFKGRVDISDLLKELKLLRAQNAVLEKEKIARKKAELETELLKTIILSVNDVENLTVVLNIIVSKICEATGWVFGQAWLPIQEKYLECSSAWYAKTEKLVSFRKVSEKLRFTINEGILGTIWVSKSLLWIRDVTEYNNFLRKDIALEVGFKSGFCIPIVVRDKVITVLEFFMHEVKDEDAAQVSLVSVVMSQLGNIIHRKQIEEELSRSTERLSLILKQMPLILWTMDKELKITMSLGSALKEINLKEGEYNGKTLYEYLQTDDENDFIISMHKRAVKGETVKYEIKWMGRMLHCHIEPLKDIKGNIEGIIGVAMDVTERNKV